MVRWGRTPQVADIESYAAELAAARIEQGKKLVGLFIMPPDSQAPDEQFRKAQAEKLPGIMQDLEYAVAVFEGNGFIASLKRSALVGILLLVPHKYPIHVRSTVTEALITHPAGPITFNAQRALEELTRRQLC